jgi:hypothetical protein
MRTSPTQPESTRPARPVPRGAERDRELARIAADARARLRDAPNPFDSVTPEQRARNRASLEPEILGSGPQRTISDD